MKKAFRNFIFLALLIAAFNQTFAQKASYTSNSGITIGFGLGASYQQSDIANSRGAGFDFSLGSHLYKKENAFLSADWKFRFLAGENSAHDHRINPDNTFSNIRYAFFNYDLELGLTLNRLRERTRIVITGFGGAGITHGRTFTDLYDANGDLYDYNVINPNQERAQVYSDLMTLSDRDYETHMVNRAAILPTLGIYIGYQLSHSFSLGIEHKTNFSLNEHNSIAGIDIDNNIQTGSRRDRNHYTTLGFKWSLGGRSSGSARRNTFAGINTSPTTIRPVYPVTPVPGPTPVIKGPPPFVDITVPASTSYSTSEERIDISARVQNVRNRQGIQVMLNGKNVVFEYYPGLSSVRSTVNLADGTNSLMISVTNESGSARDNVNIIFNKPASVAPPVIRFITPANPVTVENNIFGISVQTVNVKLWQDVTVAVNGVSTRNFNFSNEGVVNTNIGLKEGANRIEVSGKNEAGVTTERATITYVKSVKTSPPVVNILIPDANPYNTSESSQQIRANITGVKGKENISVSVNGLNTGNFTFDNSTLAFNTLLSLKEGRNVIIITARNEVGQDDKSITVIKETKPCPAPALRIIAPAQNDITTDNQSFTFRTEVKNITGRSQLTLTLNGRNINSFNFSGNELVCTISLDIGSNSFILVAKNDCGTQTVNSSIIYKPAEVVVEPKPCPIPEISFIVTAVNRQDATHELKGSVRNVKNKSDIKVSINGNPYEAFQFVPGTGEITASLKLNPGSYTILVNAKNECGQESDSKTETVNEEKSCGLRINPGNSSWQFCLVTNSKTFTRENLTDNNFSYSGPASSLYFMPIAGGGDAIVNGKTYSIKPGQYYLFTGNLTVTVSTKNPGSMGHWSVCIIANKEPVYGNGNNRPKSPCEESRKVTKPKKDDS